MLGFPCNQFGAQEPGSDAEIKAFAQVHALELNLQGAQAACKSESACGREAMCTTDQPFAAINLLCNRLSSDAHLGYRQALWYMLTLAGWQGKGAKFPLFSKIDVNGPDTHPLYKKLKKDASNKTLMSMFGEILRHAAARECQIVQGCPPSSFRKTYGPPHPIKYLICLALPMACKDRLKRDHAM